MQFPLIDKQLLSDLRLLHALYNISVAALFWYQAWMGIMIRRMRLMNAPMPFSTIRRHRTSGPVFAAAAFLGYGLGIFIVFLHEGEVFEHRLHFLAGSVTMLLLGINLVLSRGIRGPASPRRTPHFLTGLAVVILYLVQIFLGIEIFFGP